MNQFHSFVSVSLSPWLDSPQGKFDLISCIINFVHELLYILSHELQNDLRLQYQENPKDGWRQRPVSVKVQEIRIWS